MPEKGSQTVLCFDFGLRSIGAAFGQSITGTASELKPLRANNGVPDWSAVTTLVREWQPDCLMVGLPINMDDSESALSGRARAFAKEIGRRTGLEVILFDERLTSREAKAEHRERGGSNDYASDPVDSIAARLTLESWFRQRPSA